MIETVCPNIYKFIGISNIYYLKDLDLIIDCGYVKDRADIIDQLGEIVDFSTVKTVIFTHLHYDHISNFDLFKNAKFYASSEAINDLNNNREDTILDPQISNFFHVDLLDIRQLKLPEYFEIISTPGHSNGSICILDTKNKILFSGDTLFDDGNIGRYDLPTSDYNKLRQSLDLLLELEYDILCPGHDY